MQEVATLASSFSKNEGGTALKKELSKTLLTVRNCQSSHLKNRTMV